MKTLLLLLTMLLLTSQPVSVATVPTSTRSRQHYARQLRKAVTKRHVAPRKVHHAYSRQP